MKEPQLLFSMRLLHILMMQMDKQQGQVVVSFNLVEEDLMVKELSLEGKLKQQFIMLLLGVIKVYLMRSLYSLVLVDQGYSAGRCTSRTPRWCSTASKM